MGILSSLMWLNSPADSVSTRHWSMDMREVYYTDFADTPIWIAAIADCIESRDASMTHLHGK